MGFFACRWVRSRLPLVAGDDLVGPARRQVERHLVGCPDCRLHLDSLRGVLGALHEAAAIDPLPAPAPLWPGLARQIRESRRPAATVWTRLLIAPAAAAVAASVMLVAGSAWSARLSPPPTRSARATPPPRPVPEHAAGHLAKRRVDLTDYAVGTPPKTRRPVVGGSKERPGRQPTLH
jgi:anti-sigma factor RsiW